MQMDSQTVLWAHFWQPTKCTDKWVGHDLYMVVCNVRFRSKRMGMATVGYIVVTPAPPTQMGLVTALHRGGPVSNLTPLFSWDAAKGASGAMGLYIEDLTASGAPFVYPNASATTTTPLTGTSFSLPSGYLVNGHHYAWNMTSFDSAGEGGAAYANDLFFTTPANSTGSLQVSISPAGAIAAGAEWQVDGGTLQSSGATVSGLSVGNHTVSFSTVSGWTTPASQNVSVSANSTATATGTYVSNPQTGSLQVTISPTAVVTAGAHWQVDGGALQSSGVTVSGLSVGSHTVSFSTVSGWTTPASQNVSVSANSTATTTGTYVSIPSTGSLQVTISPAGAISAGAQWQVDGGTLQSSGATVSGLSVGSHTVSFSTVSGWTTPANQNVSVSANSTATTTGTYAAQTEILGGDFNAGGNPVSWSQENSQGRTFAFIKATQDNINNHPVPSNMSDQPSSFPVGMFDYADPDDYFNPSTQTFQTTDPTDSTAVTTDAKAEADFFYQTASPYFTVGNLIPALDLEDDKGNGGFDSTGLVLRLVGLRWQTGFGRGRDEFQTHMPGVYPILYMTQFYAGNLAPLLDQSKYKLWIAIAGGSTQYSQPVIPPSGDSYWNPSIWPWVIEQYQTTSTAYPPDLDVINPSVSLSSLEIATAPQTGSLQVAISPAGAISAGAQWQVDAGTLQSSGATVSGLSVGSHAVSFSTVSGWTTPANQNVSVSANSTATATGTYVSIPQTGALQVTISPAGAISAGAQWQVDGGTLQSSGATVSGLSVGSHAVSFSTVSGWTTPANQNVSVSANSTATATGTYVSIPQTGALQVTISPAGAISAGAQWQVDGGTLQSSGATVSGLSVGSHTVSFSTVSGWTTPANQNVSVSANSTATATGTYVSIPQTGALQVTISPAGAISAGAQWQVDGGTLQSSGATVSGLSVGSHTVSFSTVSGWTTPANQNVSVSANSTATATGTTSASRRPALCK